MSYCKQVPSSCDGEKARTKGKRDSSDSDPKEAEAMAVNVGSTSSTENEYVNDYDIYTSLCYFTVYFLNFAGLDNR